ncbi:hypothetical protein [Streptomyces scopuliridis]
MCAALVKQRAEARQGGGQGRTGLLRLVGRAGERTRNALLTVR